MSKLTRAVLFAVLAVVSYHVQAADLNGTWTASFDTQVGKQVYTFEFHVQGSTLTGKANSTVADMPTPERAIDSGKVEGNAVSFAETFTFQGMPLTISYKGDVAGNDEIHFKREVAGVMEEFVATRKK